MLNHISQLKLASILKTFLIIGFFLINLLNSVSHSTEIVANKSISIDNYSLNKARAIFTMRLRFWPNGEKIKVFTLPDNHPFHKKFTKNNLQMFPHQLRRVWNRIVFSGTGQAPVELNSEEEMRDKVANTPNAIGYLNTSSKNENVQLLVY